MTTDTTDILKEPGRDECPDCDGAGETCTGCHEIPDNCEHDDETFAACEACDGSGQVDVDEDEEDEEDDE